MTVVYWIGIQFFAEKSLKTQNIISLLWNIGIDELQVEIMLEVHANSIVRSDVIDNCKISKNDRPHD